MQGHLSMLSIDEEQSGERIEEREREICFFQCSWNAYGDRRNRIFNETLSGL